MKTPPSFDYYFENSLKGPAECQKQEIRAMAERRCRRSKTNFRTWEYEGLPCHAGTMLIDFKSVIDEANEGF